MGREAWEVGSRELGVGSRASDGRINRAQSIPHRVLGIHWDVEVFNTPHAPLPTSPHPPASAGAAAFGVGRRTGLGAGPVFAAAAGALVETEEPCPKRCTADVFF